MKYLKKYEELNKNYPKIGDYVVCEEDAITFGFLPEEIRNFTNNNIGKYIGHSEFGNCHIEYENFPTESVEKYLKIYKERVRSWLGTDEYGKLIRTFDPNDIKYWSENIEDLKPIITANKFNI